MYFFHHETYFFMICNLSRLKISHFKICSTNSCRYCEVITLAFWPSFIIMTISQLICRNQLKNNVYKVITKESPLKYSIEYFKGDSFVMTLYTLFFSQFLQMSQEIVIIIKLGQKARVMTSQYLQLFVEQILKWLIFNLERLQIMKKYVS